MAVAIPELPPPPQPVAEDLVAARIARARKAAPRREHHLPVGDRKDFRLVEQTLSADDAVAEAKRCLQCASMCGKCVEVCPNRANYQYSVPPFSVQIPRLAVRDGRLESVAMEPVVIGQGTQIVHIDDFCNECGNCSAFCVHEGRPYMDKPRLFLNDDDFRAEADNAFRVGEKTILRRVGGKEESATLRSFGWQYENEYVRVLFDRGFVVRQMELKQAFPGELSLRSAVEMATLYRGLRNSMSWLLK
ncbi:MAG: hypothetical protein LIQ30_11290 [Planctomycetes bacterium]|nr:hypothetical protein [Planctomycetota bacterium]